MEFRMKLDTSVEDNDVLTDHNGNRILVTNKFDNRFWRLLNKITFGKYFNHYVKAKLL